MGALASSLLLMMLLPEASNQGSERNTTTATLTFTMSQHESTLVQNKEEDFGPIR